MLNPKNYNFKDYLGDSVYADFDGYHIILTTENGFGPSNTIALEPAVLAALNRYSERMESLKKELMNSNSSLPAPSKSRQAGQD